MEYTTRYTGGCLCGALRYEAEGPPVRAGHCYCGDCRKASGSGFIPFMGFPASVLRFSGQTRISRAKAARGGEAVRNFCTVRGSLVFGGIVGQDDSHTIYAGSLDALRSSSRRSQSSPAIALPGPSSRQVLQCLIRCPDEMRCVP